MILAILACIATLEAAGGAKASAGSPFGCAPKHARLLAADTEAQVYLVQAGHGSPIIGACVIGRRHKYVLKSPTLCSHARRRTASSIGFCISSHVYRLAGPVVAYADASISEVTEEDTPTEVIRGFSLVVRDLANDRLLHDITAARHTARGPLSASALGAGSFVVKSDGAVAWVEEGLTVAPAGAPTYELRALDRTGTRVLATGPTIEPNSLALAGSNLYWTQSGQAFSSQLN